MQPGSLRSPSLGNYFLPIASQSILEPLQLVFAPAVYSNTSSTLGLNQFCTQVEAYFGVLDILKLLVATIASIQEVRLREEVFPRSNSQAYKVSQTNDDQKYLVTSPNSRTML
jgi:hypothetical protein